ncbi:MAG TPA: DPP IV N-terminal domain-containing protein [Tepidisphaeraceae bacterium]|jgi:TolB protein|nr:DPP IV N-terminal domain-containing protein [Tepidisphaeraceae bacterium]
MKIGRKQDIIRYAISAAAFIGALAVASGCSMFHHQAAVAVMPTVPVAPPARTVAVNAYGEFGGVRNVTAPAQAATAFQQHTSAVDGRDDEVAVDPTGKFLAYSSTRNSVHPDIYLQKVDGVSVVQLTDDPSDDAFPAFSPDGKTIAFSSTRNGNWDIYTMDTDGRHVVQITSGSAQDLHPSFSPDGSKLAYCSMGSRSDNWELWVVNLQTGERRMVGYGLFPTWSPDKKGDRIAFQRASQRGSRWFSLWTLDLVDGEARHVTEVASAADAALVSPTWSPDGQKIAYATIRPTVNATGAAAGEQKEIWSVNVDGTDRRRLTDGIGSNLSPAWAVDNRVYFVSDRSGAQSVWSVQAESAAPAVAAKPAEKPGVPAGAIGAVDKQEITH